MSTLMRYADKVKRAAGRLWRTQRTYAYLGRNRALTQLTTGAPFFVNTDDRAIAPWIILGGVWETFVDTVICQLAQPGMSFLDIGANMGYYTVKVGGIVGEHGHVYSFEPNPELYSFLQDNVQINGLQSRSQLWPLALGDQPGQAELGFNYENMGGGSLIDNTSRSQHVTVKIETLDRLLPSRTRIDLIKVDAEGYEPQILAGGKRLLEENPEAMMIMEVSIAHWRKWADPVDVLRGLLGTDREVFKIATSGKVIPMGGAVEFLGKITDNFVAYCLISPKASATRERLARLLADG